MIGIPIFSQHNVAVVPSNVSSTIITSHATLGSQELYFAPCEIFRA